MKAQRFPASRFGRLFVGEVDGTFNVREYLDAGEWAISTAACNECKYVRNSTLFHDEVQCSFYDTTGLTKFK